MKLIASIHPKVKLLFKLSIFILFLFLLQVILSYLFVYKTSLAQIESRLSQLTSRIEKDLRIDGKVWDTSRYNSDPLTPYPNGSSGFLNPLYIITNEGFIIERSSPIHGLLDTSDFKHLIQFQKPQTIDTVTNEKWRILSKPLEKNGKTLGVIVVSYYNPRDTEISLIDRKMKENITFIFSKIDLNGNKINTSKLDIRNIHYEFSFEIVDIYNNVLINNGRVPTYIDVSYFSKEMRNKSIRVVRDEKLGEEFIVVSRLINNNLNEPVGIILAGQSIQAIKRTLQGFSLITLFISGMLIIPLIYYVGYIFGSEIISLLSSLEKNSQVNITRLYFDKKKSTIHINQEIYEIPYTSNQYYICEALFTHPTKKWEHDQLLDKLGDSNQDQMNVRKVYDAVLAINKKVGLKLIEYKYKVYFLNPDLLGALSKS